MKRWSHDVSPHQVQHHRMVGLGLAEPVDRGDGSDDERVVAFQERLGGGEAHLLDVLVDRRVLLDIGVGGGQIGFRLVVVIVRDEVLHCVVGKELPHLSVELRGQSLVRGEHDGGPLHRLDHAGHAVGLAAARDPQQGLVDEPVLQPPAELANRLRLIPRRLEVGSHPEGSSPHCRDVHGSLARLSAPRSRILRDPPR